LRRAALVNDLVDERGDLGDAAAPDEGRLQLGRDADDDR
jgi:hypothetical protein